MSKKRPDDLSLPFGDQSDDDHSYLAHFPTLVPDGGDWAGAKGIDNAAMPQRMEVDYMRVWQVPVVVERG